VLGEKKQRPQNQQILEMNNNQKLAIEQLEKISKESENKLDIIDYEEKDNILYLNISILCKSFKSVVGGLKYHQRETFLFIVTKDFPFEHPHIITTHNRFSGFPHVQWGRSLCLYLSPSTDWDPNDGMFGFTEQLYRWLEAAALNNLDPNDAPLHPPVAYKSDKSLQILIPTVDTPVITEPIWYGFAKLENYNDKSIIIREWYNNDFNQRKQNVAAVILLSSFMPFEYPNYFWNLIDNLSGKDKQEITNILRHIKRTVDLNGKNTSLYIIIGTPMRGISTSRKQHLNVWYLNLEICKCLRSLFGVHHDKHFKKLTELTLQNRIDWCEVSEFRKEVTVKRDSTSAIEWFKGKTVELWGCGALGSYVAEYLVRAGIKKIYLRDSKKVVPGLLVRQNYFEENVGHYKVSALKNNLNRINGKLNIIQVDTSNVNILINPLDNENIFSDADIIIDTTASESAIKKLECKLCNINKSIPIVSMTIGHKALNGFVVLSNNSFKGGPWVIKRKAKLNICSDKVIKYYSDEFYPDESADRGKPFQPEPGCSENTFIGSSADISSLSSSMLNIIVNDLNSTVCQDSSAYLISQPHESMNKKIIPFREYHWKKDKVFDEKILNYKIYFDDTAYGMLISLIEKSKKGKGATSETGGILFGEWDDICKIVYIDEVTDAPKDSKRNKSEFICGVEGVKEKNEKYKKLTKGSKHFIGYWHTHPYSSPDYSSQDDNGMKTIIITLSPQRALMLIVGFDDKGYYPQFYIFDIDKLK